MQVWQIARDIRFPLAFLIGDGNDWASVLTAVGGGDHLLLGLPLKHHLDRVVRVDAAEFSIVTQHFSSDFRGNTILRCEFLGRSD